MAEIESQQGSIAIEILNKFGLPTAILIVVSYFVYSDIVKPLAGDYQNLLIEVRTNNTELRKSLLELGEENRKRISVIEDRILKNSELLADGLEKIAESNKDELGRVEAKIDQILSK